jgi:hypothetical protein
MTVGTAYAGKPQRPRPLFFSNSRMIESGYWRVRGAVDASLTASGDGRPIPSFFIL